MQQYCCLLVGFLVLGRISCEKFGLGAPVLVYNNDGLSEFDPGYGTETDNGRAKRSVEDNETTDERYDVEITVLVDYSLYEWFLESASEPDRRNKSIQAIRTYYAKIIQGADQRYQHVREQGIDVHLRLVQYLIIEDQKSSFFTENLWVRDGLKSRKKRVNSIKALIALRFWDAGRNLSLLAHSDHVMAFTRYNLYKLSTDRTNIKDHGVGIAFAESICTMESYSLIEEKGGFKSEGVAAHELGHSLGAFYHDGELGSPGEPCSADDLYVMAPVSKQARHWNVANLHQFSRCSVKQIRTYLSDNEKSWCLKNEASHVKDWDSNTDILPGQYMDVHEQCQHRTGNGSQLCGFNRDHLCRDLWCTVPEKEGGCTTTGPAARGTTCGNKRICIRGKCVEHDDAPPANDYCLYGDHPSALTYRFVPCDRFITPHPARCYNLAVNDRCCKSCYQYQNHDRPDCSYGDDWRWCASVPYHRCSDPTVKWHCCDRCTGRALRCYDDRRFRLHGYNCYSLIASYGKRQCYNRRIAKRCCRTCRRHRNYIQPSCMFGDRFQFVYRNRANPAGYSCHEVAVNPERYCKLRHVRKDCCESCAMLR